jgi:MFS family permease
VALAFVHPLWALYALIAVVAAGQAITQPAEFALTPLAAGDEVATATANAWIETARYTGWTIGPLAGGILTSAFGARVPLLVDAGTFVLLAALGLALSVRRPPHEHRPGEGGLADMLAGIRVVSRDRVVRLVMLVIGVFVLAAGFANVAEIFFAKDVLDAGDVGYGVLVAAWTVGMASGAALLGPRLARSATGGWVLMAAVTMGVAIVAASFARDLLPALIAFACGGVANGVEGVGSRTLIHNRIDEALHARASSAYLGVVNVADVAATGLSGLLIAGIGTVHTLRVAGAAALVVGLGGLLLYSRIPASARRSAPRPLSAPEPAAVAPPGASR